MYLTSVFFFKIITNIEFLSIDMILMRCLFQIGNVNSYKGIELKSSKLHKIFNTSFRVDCRNARNFCIENELLFKEDKSIYQYLVLEVVQDTSWDI